MTKIEQQAGFFSARITKWYKHLAKWARSNSIDAWLLYDRDIPEVPLRVEVWRDVLTLAGTPLAEAPVIRKERRRQRPGELYEKVGGKDFFSAINEGNLRFEVNTAAHLDTGLFLDTRALRRRIMGEAAGKRVLNLFCYTGSLTVAALAGGAADTLSVDLSANYLAWAGRNLALNGFAVSGAGAATRAAPTAPAVLLRMDVSRFLDEATGHSYDIIILDPPVFSNSKKFSGVLDLKRDAAGLVKKTLQLLSPGGKLYFSARSNTFNAEAEERVIAAYPGAEIRDISAQIRDKDFEKRKIPAWREIQTK